MTWTSDFLVGTAELLAVASVGTWRATGAYQAAETGIYLSVLPSSPPRAIALAHYDVENTPFAHGVQGLQVLCRGTANPTVANDLTDAVRDALHGLRGVSLRSVYVAEMHRQSKSLPELDSGGNWWTSSNFYALTTRAQVHALS